MEHMRRWLRRAHRQEQGNFLILGLFCLLLFAMLFIIVQDALRKSNYEEALQKLTDDAALYAAAYVPGVSVSSFVASTGALRPWMQDQNYAVGYHILSNQNAAYIDQFASAAVRDFVMRNALSNQASGFFGGNLEVTRVSPKFVARQEGNKTIIEYYVDVELKTRWGSAVMARAENITTSAIAKAIIEYETSYSITTSNYDNPTASSLFAHGMYAGGSIKINNVRGGNEVVINGDMHANTSSIDFTNNDSVSVYGTTSATGGVDTGGVYVSEGGIFPSPDIPWSFPDNPEINPSIYPGTLQTVNGDYTLSGIFPPAEWGSAYANGGTLYIKGGSLTVDGESGTDPTITGNWCFYVDNDLHFNGINATISQSASEIVFMVNGAMHLNRLRGPAVINGTVMCTGLFHTNNIKGSDFPFTINGGLYTTGDIHINNVPTGFTLNSQPMPHALPRPFVTPGTATSSPPHYSSPRVFLIN